jgi:hypothetical protein
MVFAFAGLLPLVIAFATILSQWRLLACGESRALSKIYIFAGPLHLLYAAWMTREWGAAGLVLSLFITEGASRWRCYCWRKRNAYHCSESLRVWSQPISPRHEIVQIWKNRHPGALAFSRTSLFFSAGFVISVDF